MFESNVFNNIVKVYWDKKVSVMASKKARALGINHIVLEVDDLDEALQYYSSIFEFKLRGRNQH